MILFGQVLEVLIGGLLSGVLYSLVALGFVLIYKASGVFNFAQGAMVLLAGLALVRSLDFLAARGVPMWASVMLGLLTARVFESSLVMVPVPTAPVTMLDAEAVPSGVTEPRVTASVSFPSTIVSPMIVTLICLVSPALPRNVSGLPESPT